jgi:hypothetical protein
VVGLEADGGLTFSAWWNSKPTAAAAPTKSALLSGMRSQMPRLPMAFQLSSALLRLAEKSWLVDGRLSCSIMTPSYLRPQRLSAQRGRHGPV